MNKNVKISIAVALLLVGGALYFSFSKNNAGTDTTLAAKLATELTQIPTQAGKNDFLKQSQNLTKDVNPELLDLDSQIITCGANLDALASGSQTYEGSCVAAGGTLPNTTGKYLGGQCCSALMDTVERHANLQKLQAYKSMPNIPLDPMHTPIAMAKQWIDYDNATKLTPAQQAIYNQAYAISKEKPCCCKCWHYFVDEGIAKKMIIDGIFNAQQIAAFWDASDICGG
ncbi:MAG: hypothetical protein KGJ89_03080 [Patescibacteria group bacterium]|nr:hypothetical protein [Patescibacteria group bacterium]MDE2015466.1 hypothetical protein [Patescibacteria group bacterium]MDE2226918.1 hypothetical protein [Patescibacteria group bacterium]